MYWKVLVPVRVVWYRGSVPLESLYWSELCRETWPQNLYENSHIPTQSLGPKVSSFPLRWVRVSLGLR